MEPDALIWPEPANGRNNVVRMEFYGLKMPVVKPGDDISGAILEALRKAGLKVEHGDVIVITSKIIATAQNRLVKLSCVKPSAKAGAIARRTGLRREFVQVVLGEAEEVYGCFPHGLLTLKDGVVQANAGVDVSNVPIGYAVLLPKDADRAARIIRRKIYERTGKKVGIVIADSKVQPLRVGTVGFALEAAGFEPVLDERGTRDIFGRVLKVKMQALADNLASAAEVVMGEGSQRIPAVVIRGARIRMTESKIKSRRMKISKEKCMYMSTLSRSSASEGSCSAATVAAASKRTSKARRARRK